METVLIVVCLLSVAASASNCSEFAEMWGGDEYFSGPIVLTNSYGLYMWRLRYGSYESPRNWLFYNGVKGQPFSVSVKGTGGVKVAAFVMGAASTFLPSSFIYKYRGTDFVVNPERTECYAIAVQPAELPGTEFKPRAPYILRIDSPKAALLPVPTPAPTELTTPVPAHTSTRPPNSTCAPNAYLGSAVIVSSTTSDRFRYIYYNGEAGVPFSFTAFGVDPGSLAVFASFASANREPKPSNAQFVAKSFRGKSFLELTPQSNESFAIGVRFLEPVDVHNFAFVSKNDSLSPCSLYKWLGGTFHGNTTTDTISLPPVRNGRKRHTHYYYNALSGVPFVVDLKVSSGRAQVFVSRASVSPFPYEDEFEYGTNAGEDPNLRIVPPSDLCYAVAVLSHPDPETPTVFAVSFATGE